MSFGTDSWARGRSPWPAAPHMGRPYPAVYDTVWQALHSEYEARVVAAFCTHTKEWLAAWDEYRQSPLNNYRGTSAGTFVAGWLAGRGINVARRPHWRQWR